MNFETTLAQRFEHERVRLMAVAHRLVGTVDEAEDVIQEAWLRLTRSDSDDITNLPGWLTTVVTRLAIDRLRARRPTVPVDDRDDCLVGRAELLVASDDPEADAVLAEGVSAALLHVLDSLRPAERVALVLHDSFALPFDQIGAILGRSPSATKQLASRARHKIRGTEPGPDLDRSRQREVVDAFLNASRQGDLVGLVALLDPDAVLVADGTASAMGSPAAVHGADAIAGTFAGRALAAQAVLIDGNVGIAWFVGGTAKVVWEVALSEGRIAHIDMLATPDTIASLDLERL